MDDDSQVVAMAVSQVHRLSNLDAEAEAEVKAVECGRLRPYFTHYPPMHRL